MLATFYVFYNSARSTRRAAVLETLITDALAQSTPTSRRKAATDFAEYAYLLEAALRAKRGARTRRHAAQRCRIQIRSALSAKIRGCLSRRSRRPLREDVRDRPDEV